MEQEAQLDSTQEPLRAPWGTGPPRMCMNYLCSWWPGLAAETRCVPGGVPLGFLQKDWWRGQVWVLSRQGKPTSCSESEPSPELPGCCTVWPGSPHWKEPGRSFRSCCWAVKQRWPVQSFKNVSYWCYLQPGFAASQVGGQHDFISKAPTPFHALAREVTSPQLWTSFCSAEAPVPSARQGLSWQLHKLSHGRLRLPVLCGQRRSGAPGWRPFLR